MTERAGRAWRLLATGLAFSAFGLGGLLLWLAYFPLLQWLDRDPVRRTRRARLAIHHSFRLFVDIMRGLGLLRYRISGQERLARGGQLILANHPSLIDVVFLIAMVPNADCVVKAGLAHNPFTRGPVRAAGYICNDSGVGVIDDCIASLRAGNNLIIFPEGTRTTPGRPLQLQRGAANIAIRGRCDMTPVHIRCSPPALSKELPWWKVPPRIIDFSFDVRDDIEVEPFLEVDGSEALAVRQLTRYLSHYFSPEIPIHAIP